MSFVAWRGVVQDGPESCGAFALGAVLDHVGAPAAIPIMRLDMAMPVPSYRDPAAPNPLPRTPANLYRATGVLHFIGAGRAAYVPAEPVSGRNAPSAIVSLACAAGCPTTVSISLDTTRRFLAVQVDGFHQNLFALESAMIGRLGVQIHEGVPWSPVDGGGPARLVLVNDADHWVAVTDAELYDPGTGRVGPYAFRGGPGPGEIAFDGTSMPFAGLWIDVMQSRA